MKGRHTCQAQSHVGQTKCISLMYNTSWLFHLPHSWAVSGNREESLFEHAPQSIPTILGSILICYNQWKHWIHTLCLQELFSTNVWTLQITSINKIQTSIEDMLPPPLPSMQKMLVTSHLGYYRLCCIPSIWLALNRIISRHKYIQTIGNSHQLYSADFPVAKTFTHEQSSLWDLFPSLYNTTANCITFGANIVVMF